MKKTRHKIMTFFFRRKKSFPYSRSSYYENLLVEHNNGQLYLILMKDLKNTNEIETNTEIQFMDNKKINEINKECIIRKYGNPNYKFINGALSEIEILIYRQKLGSYKTKLELHFFKNNLFLYTYTFSYLTLKEKNEIIKIIKEKYLERECKDIINYNIVDKNKNIIMLNDGVDFSIKYSRKNNIDLETILKNNEFQNSKEENKRKRDKKILFKRL
jgi:hypothetical protein